MARRLVSVVLWTALYLACGALRASADDAATAEWLKARNEAWAAYYGGDPKRATDLLKDWLATHPGRDANRLWALYNLNEEEWLSGEPRSEAAQLLDTEDFPDPGLRLVAREMSIHFRAARAIDLRNEKEASALLRQSTLHQLRDVQSLDIRALQRQLLLDHATAALLGHRGPQVQVTLDGILESLLLDREAVPFERAQVLGRIAIIYSLLGEDDLGLSVLTTLFPFWVKHFSTVSPNAMTFLMQLAIGLQRVGQFDKAANIWRHMAETASKQSFFPPKARAVFLIFEALAELLDNRAKQARDTAGAALEIARAADDVGISALAAGILAEAKFTLQDGDFKSEAPALLALVEKANSSDAGIQAYAMRVLSVVADAAGDRAKAIQAIDTALAGLMGIDREQANASFDIVRRSPVAHRRIIERFVELARADEHGGHAIEDTQEKLVAALQLLNRDPVTLGISASAAIRQTQDPRLSAAIRGFEQTTRVRASIRKQALQLLANLEQSPVDEDIAKPLAGKFSQAIAEAAQNMQTIGAIAPAYFTTSRGALARLSDLRSALKPDEAFLLFGQAGRWLVEMCVRADQVQWTAVDETDEKLLARNRDLRNVLTDYSEEAQLRFDVDAARYLHDVLFGPLSDCIGNRSLVIAPTPDLLTVPFAALLTDDPKPGTTFKEWPWFIRKHAFVLVPSPASFLYLRHASQAPRTQTAFLGFGNPTFSEATTAGGVARGMALYRSAEAKAGGLARRLPPLPDTEDELNAVREVFGANQSLLYLGSRATKKAVRNLELEDYRFVEFATHGLVAGDFTQLLEPAIALTPESDTDPDNDGLLTASEVRTLHLQADLVVLSACNTAAADGTPNAKGLSGLANAFFEAGAHALLVSQWSVYSSAATALVPAALRNLRDDPGAGASEALRRAMLSFLDGAKSPEFAHPRVWAPFLIAGDRLAARHD